MTQHLSSSQLRAARGLLNWSRAELATHTDVSEPTIHRFENDQGVPALRTQVRLRSVLESFGIDFTDNHGVRFRPEGLEILGGSEGIKRFFDNAYSYIQNNDGLIRQNGVEDKIFFKNAGEFAAEHRIRMNALRKIKKNTLVHVLTQEGSKDFRCPEYAEYRWLSRTAPMPVPYYIFGDTVGILSVDQNMMLRIYQITSPVMATTYVKQFDSAWKLANRPITRR